MNLKKLSLALLLAVLASFISILIVSAEEGIGDYDNVSAEQVVNDISETVNSEISEGEKKYDPSFTFYSLIVFPKSAVIGQAITAVAETDNPRVTHVTFVWVKPFGGVEKVETVQVHSENGLKKASSTYNPDKVGSWWVFALFENKGTVSSRHGWLYAMRWTHFRITRITQQIPDYPVLGTAGAMATMFMGLGLFLSKKKQKPI